MIRGLQALLPSIVSLLGELRRVAALFQSPRGRAHAQRQVAATNLLQDLQAWGVDHDVPAFDHRNAIGCWFPSAWGALPDFFYHFKPRF